MVPLNSSGRESEVRFMKQEFNYSGNSGEIFFGDLRVGNVGEWSLKDEGNTLHFIAKQYFLNKFWMEGISFDRVLTLKLNMGPVRFVFHGKLMSRNFKLGKYVRQRLYLRSFEKLELVST